MVLNFLYTETAINHRFTQREVAFAKAKGVPKNNNKGVIIVDIPIPVIPPITERKKTVKERITSLIKESSIEAI